MRRRQIDDAAREKGTKRMRRRQIDDAAREKGTKRMRRRQIDDAAREKSITLLYLFILYTVFF